VDIFDKIAIQDTNSKKPVILRVLSPSQKEDIFDKLEKEFRPLVKKLLTEPNKNDVEMTKRMLSLIRGELSKIKMPEKVIEKIIEKEIVKEPKKDIPKPVDNKLSRQIEDLIKKVSELETDLRKEQGRSHIYSVPIRLPEQMGNGNKFLKTIESGGGSTMQWQDVISAFDNTYFPTGKGLVFQSPDGTFYLLSVGNGGVLQTTEVTP